MWFNFSTVQVLFGPCVGGAGTEEGGQNLVGF